VPAATHVVLSVGGNDVLAHADILDLPASSTAMALRVFTERAAIFESSYVSALEAVLQYARQTAVCTIYNGNLTDPVQAAHARTALAVFNDVIWRAAIARGLDIIELRQVCSMPEDYANPIEPSGHGGEKIARSIGCVVGAMPSGPWSTAIGYRTP
jgi:hypothetical protein